MEHDDPHKEWMRLALGIPVDAEIPAAVSDLYARVKKANDGNTGGTVQMGVLALIAVLGTDMEKENKPRPVVTETQQRPKTAPINIGS